MLNFNTKEVRHSERMAFSMYYLFTHVRQMPRQSKSLMKYFNYAVTHVHEYTVYSKLYCVAPNPRQSLQQVLFASFSSVQLLLGNDSICVCKALGMSVQKYIPITKRQSNNRRPYLPRPEIKKIKDLM